MLTVEWGIVGGRGGYQQMGPPDTVIGTFTLILWRSILADVYQRWELSFTASRATFSANPATPKSHISTLLYS